jgi:glycolate oxidase
VNYNKIDNNILTQLIDICGKEDVIFDKIKFLDYAHDEYIKPSEETFPEVVVKPQSTQEVSQIMSLAEKSFVPVTIRGGGTGLSGGAVSFTGGILLSMEKMNKILDVDTKNFVVTTQAGVLLKDFVKEIEKYNLFFPPKPGDEFATIGGMIATNAGGTRTVKYGTMRNFVRGVEVVLSDGSVINVGGKFIKNSAGYSLLNLFIGSEGSLGIVTESIISVMPRNVVPLTLIVAYNDIFCAINSVPEILKLKNVPVSVEFIELEPVLLTEKLLDKQWPVKVGKAQLMIIIDSSCEECMNSNVEYLQQVCKDNDAIEIFVADSKVKQDTVLEIRSNLYESIKNFVVEILDISVPPAQIALFVNKLHSLEKKYSIWLPTYGHAADGNVHTHYMKCKYVNGEIVPLEENEWLEKKDVIINEIIELGISLGGSISGEHGIGIAKKSFMKKMYSEKYLSLLKSIKNVFDKKNILNPGKVVPD